MMAIPQDNCGPERFVSLPEQGCRIPKPFRKQDCPRTARTHLRSTGLDSGANSPRLPWGPHHPLEPTCPCSSLSIPLEWPGAEGQNLVERRGGLFSLSASPVRQNTCLWICRQPGRRTSRSGHWVSPLLLRLVASSGS
jgi:hypothetical protein